MLQLPTNIWIMIEQIRVFKTSVRRELTVWGRKTFQVTEVLIFMDYNLTFVLFHQLLLRLYRKIVDGLWNFKSGNNKCLWGTYYSLFMCTILFNPPPNPWGGDHMEEPEAQRGWAVCPKSHSCDMPELKFRPRSSLTQDHALTDYSILIWVGHDTSSDVYMSSYRRHIIKDKGWCSLWRLGLNVTDSVPGHVPAVLPGTPADMRPSSWPSRTCPALHTNSQMLDQQIILTSRFTDLKRQVVTHFAVQSSILPYRA